MMSSYWVNSAKSGDPNGPGLPKWPAFTENDQTAMVFDTASSARPVPNLEKLKVFNAYYAGRREEAKKTVSSKRFGSFLKPRVQASCWIRG